MAEIKDKVVTVESLKALHDYNQKMYMPMENPEAIGDLSISGDVYVGRDFTDAEDKGTKLVKASDIIPINNGGTNATDGATGLKNLFAAGSTVLSSHQYGNTLPSTGIKGQIFFKILTD